MPHSRHSQSDQSRNDIEDERRESWADYQDSVIVREDVLNGDFNQHFRDYIKRFSAGEAWDLYKDKWIMDTLHWLSADVLESTTKTYKRPATRAFRLPVNTEDIEPQEGVEPADPADAGEPTFQPDPVFQNILESGLAFDPDEQFHRAQKLSLAGIGTVIRPLFDPDAVNDDGTPSENAKLLLQTLTADQFTAIVDDLKPEVIRGIDYTISQPDSEGGVTHRRFVWASTDQIAESMLQKRGMEAGVYELDDEDKIVSQMTGTDYPFIDDDDVFVLPFTPLRPFAAPDRLFNRTLGEDLVEATLKANWYEQNKEWVLRNASAKHIVATGSGVGKLNNKLVAPGVPIIVESADASEIKLEILDLESDPELFGKAILALNVDAKARRGQIDSPRTAQRQSADAIREERQLQHEYNDTLQGFMRPVEQRFWSQVRMVWNASQSEKISDVATYFVDFGNPFQTDPYENMEKRLVNVDRNLESGVDIVMDLEPDLKSREEGLEKIRQNRAENRASKQTTEQEAVVASSTPPPNEGTEVAPTLEQTAAEQDETLIAVEAEGV